MKNLYIKDLREGQETEGRGHRAEGSGEAQAYKESEG